MNSCNGLRQELAQCLLQTDCVRSGKTGDDCLRNHMNELPADCQAYYKGFVNCKRGLLDMRKRFRGNAPLTTAGNKAPGGTSTISSSVSDEAQPHDSGTRTSDPARGLSPDRGV